MRNPQISDMRAPKYPRSPGPRLYKGVGAYANSELTPVRREHACPYDESVTRVSVSPGRDLSKPLVVVPRTLRDQRDFYSQHLGGISLFVLALLGGISFVLLVFVH